MELTKLLIGCCLLAWCRAQKTCPEPKSILPCRCIMRAEEYQIWCTHSDLPSVLEGLKAISRSVKEPIDEVILENNYLPSLPGRTFFPLKILRLMLSQNGLESVSNDWLVGLEGVLVELFLVEPKLRHIPDDALLQLVALQAVTIQTKSMKRLPLVSGLPKLRYFQAESTALQELSPRNFKNNPSLEKLHIGNCQRLDRLEADQIMDLPSLFLLNISNCGIAWMHHRALTGLPVLQELILAGNRISDAGMVGRSCRELPRLETLRLDDNSIEILGEASFVDLPALTSLYLTNNKITELHHGAFHRVPRLKKLILNGNSVRRVHPESFLQESGSGLEELWLIQNQISHVADLRAIFDALPRLVFLDMSHNQLEAIPFDTLRGHATLEYLNLAHNRLHLVDREAFVAMPALRELKLRNNSLSNTLQSPLWNLPELKGLDLAENYFRRLDANFLENLPSLRKIDISHNELTFIDPEAFDLTPSLENVNLSFNGLATVHSTTFQDLRGLYELDLSNNVMVEFVPGLPRSLEYLHLKNNKIASIPASAQFELPALRLLNLHGNKLESLPREGLATMPQLRKLFLDRNGLRRLENGNFKGLTRLEVLDVSENHITHVGRYVFRQQSELRDLNLGANRLDVVPPDCLEFCPRLKRLNLTRNGLTDLLQGTLDKNSDLQLIDVSGNKLTRLSSTFMGLRNLRTLDVTRNKLNSIDPEVLAALPALTNLKLAQNNIRQLKENAFNKLQHLTSLDIEQNALETVESNAIKLMPALKSINLSSNKIKEIPNAAFVNLPSLQMVELQDNQIRAIAPQAFTQVPHLLLLNLSYNQIPTFEEAGLRGVTSLELLDISHNRLRSTASPSLKRLEWLVELRADNNQICGVQGSPFNDMPRLRVLSIRNNKMMSFPERAVERIRGNIAVLDIEGNPLACSCNMLWLQGWLHETASIGPTCANGILLKELELLRRNCPEEERNVELVAPGCESELLSAPGVYGAPQDMSQWMHLKSLNESQNGNSVAPLPEESEYFYEKPVYDYAYNDAHKAATTLKPLGDTPTIYASPKSKLSNKNIPKEVNQSPSSSGFTFFGVPLPNIGNILGDMISNGRKDQPKAPIKMDDRMAIVNKPSQGAPNLPRAPNMPPNMPKIEGGFTPMFPGTGGFKPIPNPFNQPKVDKIVEKDASTVESNEVFVSTSTKPEELTTETVAMTSPNPSSTALPPFTTTISTETSEKPTPPKRALEPPATTDKMALIRHFNSSRTEQISVRNETIIAHRNIQINSGKETIATMPETTTFLPVTTTEVATSTSVPPAFNQNQTAKLYRQQIFVESTRKTHSHVTFKPQTSFLVPEQNHPKKMATITKISAPNLPLDTAPLRSELDALPPMAHNREPKKFLAATGSKADNVQQQSYDNSWYFASYDKNSSGINCCSYRLMLILIMCFLI